MEESIKTTDLLKSIKEEFELEDVDVRTYNPLTLAFIGDCVFEMIIRSILVCKGNKSVNAFAKEKKTYVDLLGIDGAK